MGILILLKISPSCQKPQAASARGGEEALGATGLCYVLPLPRKPLALIATDPLLTKVCPKETEHAKHTYNHSHAFDV